MAKKKKEKEIMHRIQFEIELFTGGKIGVATLLSDIQIRNLIAEDGREAENFLKHITERAVRSAVDLLVIKGAEKIAQESATKTNPK